MQGARLPAKPLEHGFICELIPHQIHQSAGGLSVPNKFVVLIMQVMADKNLEDGDIEPAPKLVQVLFQNCKGQVDQWVEPYLRITVERLHRTEKPYLKCLLMEVVSTSLYSKF